MIHYHGTPISGPAVNLERMAGRHFCVSYATPYLVEKCHRIGQSVMLDNAAFTFWRKGVSTSPEWWDRYYEWVAPWLDYHTTWAVIPDVIDGTEEENDYLLTRFCRKFGKQGAPVWHMHESLDRLMRLCVGYGRVCIGSSGEYAELGTSRWNHRMDEAFNRICDGGKTRVPIHMLRAMEQASTGPWPFASADSTNAGQNGHRSSSLEIAGRLDAMQAPARWSPRSQLSMVEADAG